MTAPGPALGLSLQGPGAPCRAGSASATRVAVLSLPAVPGQLQAQTVPGTGNWHFPGSAPAGGADGRALPLDVTVAVRHREQRGWRWDPAPSRVGRGAAHPWGEEPP